MSEILELEEQRLLNLTLTTREKVINHLMSQGVPTKTSDQIFLVSILDGLDRTVLTKAKIKADKDDNEEKSRIQDMVANVLLHSNDLRVIDNINTPKELSKEYEVIDLVPGETDIGQQDLSYEKFINSM